jgi:hypothetical protein
MRERETIMMFRQGDVLIRKIPAIPNGTEVVPKDPDGAIVLARGEVTGHRHRIDPPTDEAVEFVRTADTNQRFLRIMASSGVELRHEEHATITLPPGIYEVVQQREYTPEAIVRVVD